MKIDLIICTYMRPEALCKLLDSVQNQAIVPDYVTIVDGSTNDLSREAVMSKNYALNIRYHKVSDSDRGLTKQRNYGISHVQDDVEIVAFLDDDTVLESEYFSELVKTFKLHKDAVSVGGYVIEPYWKTGVSPKPKFAFYEFDGWYRNDAPRTVVRKLIGLGPSGVPCVMPPESHGRPLGSIPPSGKIYEVESFMGCAMAFRKEPLKKTGFSTYFEGYGLYEDMDFCIRIGRLGRSYVNTNARLHHYHEPSGRPSQFKYGKMVVRNGWYVWRVKYEFPSVKAKFKWWMITLVQTIMLIGSSVTTRKPYRAITELFGRVVGMASVLIDPPRIQR